MVLIDTKDDYDSPWKDILESYFQEFLMFFFPEAAQGVDWSKEYVFLDKELQQITRDSELGRRFADKLVKVYSTAGEEVWVLIHIEVQGQEDPSFLKRMFTYNYRIFDRYDHPVASFAILADDAPNWRPAHYGWRLWGCEMGLHFPAIKLLDYSKDWEKLVSDLNPFSVVVMAHLKARQTRSSDSDRFQWKLQLIRMLYERGYSRKDVLNLFRFMDWVLRLPDALEANFWEEIQQFEEAKNMPYITSVERIGIKKGLQQGIEQGIEQGLQRGIQRGIEQGLQRGIEQGIIIEAQEMVIEAVRVRFGEISSSIIEKIKKLDSPQVLKGLLKKAINAANLEEFQRELHMNLI